MEPSRDLQKIRFPPLPLTFHHVIITRLQERSLPLPATAFITSKTLIFSRNKQIYTSDPHDPIFPRFYYIMHKWNLPYRKDDVESGGNSGERPLYPTMLESPELRWGFIRKVYSIIAFQLLLTIAVAATVVTVRPIAVFFSTTSAGLALWIVLIITPLLGKAF